MALPKKQTRSKVDKPKPKAARRTRSNIIIKADDFVVPSEVLITPTVNPILPWQSFDRVYVKAIRVIDNSTADFYFIRSGNGKSKINKIIDAMNDYNNNTKRRVKIYLDINDVENGYTYTTDVKKYNEA